MIVLLFDNSRVDVSKYLFSSHSTDGKFEAWKTTRPGGGLRNRLHVLASRARGLIHPLFIPHPLHLHREGENSEQRAQRVQRTRSMAPSQPHPTHHRRPPSRHPDLGVPLFSLAPSPSASSHTARPHGDTDSDSVDDIAEMSLERLALSPPATATTISTTLAPPTPTTPTSSSTATTTHPVVTADIETAAGVTTGAVFTGVGINPPTPAPSPGPHIRGFEDSDTHIREHLEQLIYHGNANTSTDTESQDEEAKAKAHLPDPSPSPSTPTPQTILSQYTSLPPLLRSKFLNLLIPHLALHEALSLSRKIEPLLRRDFLRELPWEVALHVLSFVSRAVFFFYYFHSWMG